jgi:hypothetical protein
MAALAAAKPPLHGLRQGSTQWLRPELRVRVKHLKVKGVRRQAAGPSHAAVAPTSTKLVTNSAYHERLSDSYSACNTVVVTGSS